jgi:hypothetical protein
LRGASATWQSMPPASSLRGASATWQSMTSDCMDCRASLAVTGTGSRSVCGIGPDAGGLATTACSWQGAPATVSSLRGASATWQSG